MNFESMLRRYIAHVQSCEGTDYIDSVFTFPNASYAFTTEEKAWLDKVAQEEWDKRK